MKKNNNSGTRKLLRTLKWLLPLAIIAGLVALAFVPKPIEVDVGTTERGAMFLTINDDGETRVRERYTISSPLSGQLLRIGLKPGDPIKKGDVLAVITPVAPHLLDPRTRAQSEAQVKAAEAGVNSSQIQLAAREVDLTRLEKGYQRNKILHENGNIADATFEQIEGSYLAAKHAHYAAQSAVEISRFDLVQARAALLRYIGTPDQNNDGNFIIHSPIDGRILRVPDKSSRTVQPGTPLLVVGNHHDLEIRVDVLSQDAVSIKPGQKVIIRHWGGSSTLSGRVRLVEPSAFTKVSALGVDEQRVNIIVDFDNKVNTQSLGDGYRVEAGIIIWESNDALKVPAGALFRQGENWAAYRVSGKRAVLTTIKIGRNNGEVAEVLSGLDADDQVILHPGDRIEDGTLIKPRS